jgi:hypothetical protein
LPGFIGTGERGDKKEGDPSGSDPLILGRRHQGRAESQNRENGVFNEMGGLPNGDEDFDSGLVVEVTDQPFKPRRQRLARFLEREIVPPEDPNHAGPNNHQDPGKGDPAARPRLSRRGIRWRRSGVGTLEGNLIGFTPCQKVPRGIAIGGPTGVLEWGFAWPESSPVRGS